MHKKLADLGGMILTVSRLTVRLDGQIILQDINFTVAKNTWLLILGPNGAGKSTLLRTLLGFVPYNGSIIWNERDLSYVPPQERINRKGLPPLTVADFFSLKSVSKPAMRRLLHDVGLETTIEEMQFGQLLQVNFNVLL